MYREFWGLFTKGYGRLGMAVSIILVTIAVSLLEGFNIGLLVPLLENLESSGPEGGHWVSRAVANIFEAVGLPFNLKSVLGALAVLILAMGGLKYLRMILVAKAVEGFVVWMRSKTMSNLLHADMSYFHKQKLGKLNDTLTTQANLAGDSAFQITDIIASLGVIVAYLVAAFLITPVLTAVALGMLLIVVLAMQYHISKAKPMGVRLVEQNSELQTAALESLSGIRVIRSFLLERPRLLHFSSKAAGVGEAAYRLRRNQSQMIVFQEIALFALIGGIVYMGVSVLGLDIPVIVALLFILYRLMPRVTTLNTRRQSFQATIASIRSVKNTIDETSSPTIVSGDKQFAKLHRGIELNEVSFSYDGGGQVLQNASFTIEKGKMTAIVGTSGAGKSTLMDLILRYYDPVKGHLTVDGVDLRELDLASWRRSIGVVSQDIFLFNDTIADNIALGSLGASQENIVQAATRAYAHEFIQQLPEGYDTRVGDRGWNLSGGQRQRIALARAILKEPDILILDEATSSLDSESEQLIQDYISEIRGGCTIVAVAHRMSTIQGADRILVLQDGMIVEEGDWDSLLAGSGVFAAYHRLQFGS